MTQSVGPDDNRDGYESTNDVEGDDNVVADNVVDNDVADNDVADYESVMLDEHDDMYPTMHRAVMEVASTYNCLSCIDDAATFPNSPPPLRRSHAMRGYAIIVLQCVICGTTHDHTVYF